MTSLVLGLGERWFANRPASISADQLREIATLTVELTRLRQNEIKHLCIENFAPDLFASLVRAYRYDSPR